MESSLPKYLEDIVLTDPLIGREVVVEKTDGFHYGILLGYTADHRLLLGNYYHSRKRLDTFEYGIYSLFNGTAVVPGEGIVSVGEIPLYVEEVP